MSCLAFGGGTASNQLSAECASGMHQHPLRKSKVTRSTETADVVGHYNDSASNAATPPRHKRHSLIKSLHRSAVSFGNSQDIVGQGRAKKNKIHSYISNQKWSKLRKYLDTEEGQLIPAESEEDQDQETLLHLACQAHPPLDIIQRLQEANPSWISAKDQVQRLPLHVAAAKGAHTAVVQYLLELSPQDALSMEDFSGRTPLQLHQDLCSRDDQTCDPSSFCQEEHDRHREITLDNMIDADLDKFTEFVTVNAYRTYGPIEEVVAMLQQAQRGGSLQASSQEENCGSNSDGDDAAAKRSRSCSNVHGLTVSTYSHASRSTSTTMTNITCSSRSSSLLRRNSNTSTSSKNSLGNLNYFSSSLSSKRSSTSNTKLSSLFSSHRKGSHNVLSAMLAGK
jgi:hypothetical protein